MRDFNNKRSGGNRSNHRGSKNNFGSRDNRQGEMHDAVCAECGKDCKIPFFPRSGKPVFCSDCFEKQNSQGNNSRSNDRRSNFSDRRDSRSRNDRPQVNYKEQFEIVNSKLDKVLSLLEKIDRNSKTEKPKKDRPGKVKTVAEIIAQSVEE